MHLIILSLLHQACLLLTCLFLARTLPGNFYPSSVLLLVGQRLARLLLISFMPESLLLIDSYDSSI